MAEGYEDEEQSRSGTWRATTAAPLITDDRSSPSAQRQLVAGTQHASQPAHVLRPNVRTTASRRATESGEQEQHGQQPRSPSTTSSASDSRMAPPSLPRFPDHTGNFFANRPLISLRGAHGKLRAASVGDYDRIWATALSARGRSLNPGAETRPKTWRGPPPGSSTPSAGNEQQQEAATVSEFAKRDRRLSLPAPLSWPMRPPVQPGLSDLAHQTAQAQLASVSGRPDLRGRSSSTSSRLVHQATSSISSNPSTSRLSPSNDGYSERSTPAYEGQSSDSYIVSGDLAYRGPASLPARHGELASMMRVPEAHPVGPSYYPPYDIASGIVAPAMDLTETADLPEAQEAPPPKLDLPLLMGPALEPRSFQLSLRQQPWHGRMCGFGMKDRRPLDPLPILQLRIFDRNGEPDLIAQSSPNLLMRVSLSSAEGTENISLVSNPNANTFALTRMLEGKLYSSGHVVRDLDGERACFFVFPDLSVRLEGVFRLTFSLIRLGAPSWVVGTLGSSGGTIVQEITTEPFTVYNPRRFPGMTESSDLAKALANQGVHIPIRNDVRRRGDQDR